MRPQRTSGAYPSSAEPHSSGFRFLRTNIVGVRLRIYPGARPLWERHGELEFMRWCSLRLGIALAIFATGVLMLSRIIDLVEWYFNNWTLQDLWPWLSEMMKGVG